MENKTPPTSFIERFLAFFFKHLYHDAAWAYDPVAWAASLGRWKGWVIEIIPYLQGKRILELGFGPGHLLAALEAAGFKAFGADESHQMALLASRRLRPRYPPRVLRARAEALPYPSSCFDCVCATFPTPYILRPETATEIERILCPGGKLIVLLAARPSKPGLPAALINWLFKATGQSAPPRKVFPRIADVYTQVGLAANVRWEERNNTSFLLLIATKNEKRV